MRFFLLAILAVTFGMGSARASLLSTDITLNYDLNAVSSSDVITVTNATEVSCPGGLNICSILTAPSQTIDIGAFSITYTYTGPGASYNAVTPNQFDFQNLNAGSPIVAVLLSTNIVGLDNSRLTFTGDSIQLRMTSLTLAGPQSGFTLELITADQVPEPSTLSLAGLSIFGIAALRLRASRATRKRS